ncbi:MAG: hypothetical protein KDD47_07650, partial [Acidobacteria bacterium]|nr:hypothetical protein [Acidobacteriota bacterium]
MTTTEAPRSEYRLQRAGFWLFASHLFAIFSMAASNLLLGAGILLSPWLGRPWPRWTPATRRWLAWLGAYVALYVVSALLSSEPRISLRALWGVFFNLSVPVLALVFVRTEEDVRRVVRGLVVLGAILATVGLVQYLLGQNDLEHRIRGSLSHYMTFAGVLLACDCLLLAWMACGNGWRRIWAWAALVVIQLALLGSYTRNAWVALVVAVTVMIVVRAPKFLLAYLPLGVLLVVLAPAP